MRRWMAAAAAGLLLSGCLAPAESGADGWAGAERPDAKVVVTSNGAKPAAALTAEDRVEAPVWQLGDRFGLHVFLPSGDPAGRHYDTVVVDTTDGYLLAATDPETAKEEAVLDLPVAGRVDPRNLATSAYGLDWDLFRFPLHDGATWAAGALVRDLTTWTVYDFAVGFTARYEAAIDVQGTPHPGFIIEGRTAEGDLLFAHDYVPELGWYAHLAVFNVQTDDPDDHWFRAVSMGRGSGWGGTYYVDTATELIAHWTTTSPFASPQPAPAVFEVPAGHDTLHAFTGAFAWNGAERLVLVDPDGTTHERAAVHAGLDDTGAADSGYGDLPNLPGTWSILGTGAGAFAGALAVVWGVDHATGTLPPTHDA